MYILYALTTTKVYKIHSHLYYMNANVNLIVKCPCMQRSVNVQKVQAHRRRTDSKVVPTVRAKKRKEGYEKQYERKREKHYRKERKSTSRIKSGMMPTEKWGGREYNNRRRLHKKGRLMQKEIDSTQFSGVAYEPALPPST